MQVSCDWRRAGHVTTIAASDWPRCFLLSGSEAVTKADAEVLCAFHSGAWVAEIDRPGQGRVIFIFRMFTRASNKPSQSFKCNHVEDPSYGLLLAGSEAPTSNFVKVRLQF